MRTFSAKTPRPTAAQERAAYIAAADRDNDQCQRCQRGEPLNRHHRKGRGVGGLTVVENLALLCGSGTTGCHGWVTAHPAEAVREGWGVPGWADPAEYPARRYIPSQWGTLRLAWVIYDNEGCWEEITADEARERGRGLIP